MMKHLQTLSKAPAKAQDSNPTIGQILTFIVQMMDVIVVTLSGKEGQTTTTTDTES